MLSFQVPVLGSLFVSFRPTLIRFPQLFLRCLPYAFAFGTFRFPSAFFRPLPFRLRLLSFLFLPFPSSCLRLSVAFPVLRFFLSASLFSTFSSAWFPMLQFRFPVLGFLFVSFHPSRLRSHSCSTGASLLFRFLSSASLPGFSARLLLSFVRFCSLLTTQLSALSFPFFPFSPGSGSFGASFLFCPACCHAILPIPVLSFLQFLSPPAGSPHSGYPCVSAFRFLFRPLPLGIRFRFWLLGFEAHLHGVAPRSFRCSRRELRYIITRSSNCQALFLLFLNFFAIPLFRIFQASPCSETRKCIIQSYFCPSIGCSIEKHRISFETRCFISQIFFVHCFCFRYRITFFCLPSNQAVRLSNTISARRLMDSFVANAI